MGIFDFAKEGSEELKVETLLKLITEQVNVTDLNVKLAGDKVTVSGTAANEEDKAKVLSLLNEAKGVASVEDQLQVARELGENAAQDEKGQVVYTVQYGDTLWGISERFLGDGSKYMKIFEANKEVWKDHNNDPNVLYPNWKLIIPSE